MLTKKGFDKKLIEESKPIAQDKEDAINHVQVPQSSKDPLVIVLVLLITAIAFFAGIMWSKVSLLEKRILTQIDPAPSTANIPTPNPIAPQAQPTVDPSKVERLTATDHILGNKNAPLQLIVYSDFECPFSKRFQTTTLKQIADQYKNKVAIIYRHFPLDVIHSKARKEAQATECAAKLTGNEGFWKLTDKIYETTNSNNSLNLDSLPALAAQAGLDQKDFNDCLNSDRMAQTVESQYQSGVKVGIRGTPGSILLNTKTNRAELISGALPFDQLKPVIDSLLL